MTVDTHTTVDNRMAAAVYTRTGGPEVIEVVRRPVPRPERGQVRVRVSVSGVNPTDWRARAGEAPGRPVPFGAQTPNQDGAGTIDAVGTGVAPERVGQRVWVWEAAWRRPGGTAAEFVVVPEHQAVPLPDGSTFALGASLGIPALTAHRALTVGEGGPDILRPAALAGQTVLVAGGAGAVGHAAIELARWAGAVVVSTVSSAAKAELATAAGARHVVNYRDGNPAEAIRAVAPAGVDIVVEVNPAANAALNQAVLAEHGTIAVYAFTADQPALHIPVRPAMFANTRVQFVLVYTVPAIAKANAVRAVQAALADGALRVGAENGLPLHRYSLRQIVAAHAAVANNVVGKVLVDVIPQ
ncbi:NADPH:quinone reductase [Parafrankia discariae]|uniref:NADPH:quinone reductase n=1 Tax=Parafrankia discariae TaxID=365528 RepID=UPI0003627397|nr:NADPH:quinone reductase [Parafrankia discariae]